jgi:hypothetical protein
MGKHITEHNYSTEIPIATATAGTNKAGLMSPSMVDDLVTAKSGATASGHTHTTDQVSEGTNKYFSNALAIASVLTGYVKATTVTAIATTTTILQAIGILEKALDNKVNVEIGKGLSTNDYTTDEKNKLSGIATNANNYSHPSGTVNVPSTALTGAVVVSQITNDTSGHPTAVVTRSLSAADVGAATTSHNHDVAAFTSGTLGFTRGGTGTSSFTASRFVRVNASNTALETRTNAEVLTDIGAAASSHNHVATEITSGTLPDGRLSTNVPLLASTNNFTGLVRVGGTVAMGTSGARLNVKGLDTSASSRAFRMENNDNSQSVDIFNDGTVASTKAFNAPNLQENSVNLSAKYRQLSVPIAMVDMAGGTTLTVDSFPETEKAKLRLSTNWTSGSYTGEPLVGCFHGTTLCERGIDLTYAYYMIEDNFPARLRRE